MECSNGGPLCRVPENDGNPKFVILHHNLGNALQLEATYDPPGNTWFIVFLGAAIIAGVAVGVLLGISTVVIGAVGGGMVAGIYTLVQSWRKRKATLDVSACTDAVFDRKHRCMAFFMPIENGEHWVVLEFAGDFAAAAADAVGELMGPRFRAASIERINRGLLWFVLAILLCFVLAFVYFMVNASTAR